jgi:hypothetical protein
MIRASVTGLAILWFSAPVLASDFTANDQGQIEFSLPSGNIGCVYTPEGGTDTYEPAGGGPELSCDRVAPSYVRVILGPEGKARRYNDVGDASCCGGGTFAYGKTWDMGPFQCKSAETGLTCRRHDGRGFTMSRKSIKTF